MNQKKMFLIIGIFLVILLISYTFLNQMEKGQEKAKSETESVEKNESIAADQNVLELQSEDNAASKDSKNDSKEYSKEELKEIEPELEIPRKSDFKIKLKGLNDEVKKMINGNEDELKKKLAEFLYQYNYVTVKKATFLNEVLINYNKNTVTLYFYLDDKENSKVEATYSKDTKEITFATYY